MEQRQRRHQRLSLPPAAAQRPPCRPHPPAPGTAALRRGTRTAHGVCGQERTGAPREGFPAGTPWQRIPDDWSCPDCGAAKADFEMTEITHA
ncbi:rubredoxin [Streptomyces peucetius]|uniref:rubredoxin n=1 Tax=Streptomyces peucetius TaxID=1950 RepID=UPI00299F6B43|nr:rubredoxin [Streptomyces peucetius]